MNCELFGCYCCFFFFHSHLCQFVHWFKLHPKPISPFSTSPAHNGFDRSNKANHCTYNCLSYQSIHIVTILIFHFSSQIPIQHRRPMWYGYNSNQYLPLRIAQNITFTVFDRCYNFSFCKILNEENRKKKKTKQKEKIKNLNQQNKNKTKKTKTQQQQ